ncbi:MAG: DUF6443 domain-containing protein, partial [Bacteroidota bacterium]
DRAYTRTRIDYAPEPTGNSQFNFRENFAYVDGLGRLIQTVERQHSTDSLDVVIVQEYDNQGRIERLYEPFKSSFNTGEFVSSIPSPTNQVYTETRYWASPLNRIRGTTPPVWEETLCDYENNLANEVQNLATGGFYTAGELTKKITTDPNGNQLIVFKDKRNRVVLTRRDSTGGIAQTADTYTLYDNKDRPIKIVPPSTTLADGNLVYSYLYNDDNKMIMQKIPDKDSIYMQYDDRELLTAMQDGVMRDSSRWLVSIMDDYGRLTQTGFYQNMSTNPDSNTPSINNGLLTETFYDGGFGVDATISPIYYGRVRKTRTSILDGYLPTNNFIETTFNYDDFGRTNSTTGNNHVNLANGSEQMTMQYDFADNVIISTHDQMAHGITTSIQERTTYDHKGRQINAFHQVNGNTEEHCSSQEYGVRDLVLKRKLGGLGNDDFLQVVDYRYNAQRWLTQINTPLPQDGMSGGESESSPSDPDDLFYMRINYQTSNNDVNASGEDNGNISNVKWQVLGENKLSVYGYQYDFLDRLVSATFGTQTGSTTDVDEAYSTSYTYDLRGNISKLNRNGKYEDVIQNIDSLSYGYFPTSNKVQSISDDAPCPTKLTFAEDIEQSEDYRASQCITFKAGFSFSGAEDGVMTAKISCVSKSKYTKGFVQRSLQSYEYDVNGNQTRDPHKKIDIQYNHLNLPYEVNWDNGNKIEWLYAADGTKLKKLASKPNKTVSEKDYLGELEYESDSLEAIYHTEGRVVPNNGGFKYQYRISDYLNNTRVVFQNNGSGEAEIISQSAYYPVG